MSPTTDARQELHRLVDQLRDGDLYTAKRMLEYLHYTADPVRRALDEAPEDDEDLTEEDNAAIAEARAAAAEGRVLSTDALWQRLEEDADDAAR